MKLVKYLLLFGILFYISGGVLTYLLTGYLWDAVLWPVFWVIMLLAGLAFRQ